MTTKRFAAVDLGASSGRVMVAEVSPDRLALREVRRFDNGIVRAGEGLHWDVARLAGEVRAGLASAEKVDGIGIDTWGVDYGLVDGRGELVAMPTCYRDPRHEAGLAIVAEALSAKELYGRCGIQRLAINTIYQVAAQWRAQPELFETAERLLLMPDLFGWLLTGEPTTEYTIASTTGLLDARTRDWAWDVIEALGLPEVLFGEVRMPGSAAGDYDGAPVYLVGGHDTASAVAAIPASGDDWAFLSSGTWSLIGIELDEPLLSPAAAGANFTNEGGVDGSIRFLKNVTGLWLLQECRRMWAEAGKPLTFAEIATAAAAADFNGTFEPNDPRFTAPGDMVAAIQGWFRERGEAPPTTVGEVARACYLSLAKAYADELAQLRELTGRRIARLHVVGGGARAALLNQLTANACGIPVLAGPVEATALGNAGVQAMTTGVYADLAALRTAVAASYTCRRYDPQ